MSDPEQGIGLYRKYNVVRRSDPKGRHLSCEYFVLDLTHDEFAMAALTTYAKACKVKYPYLSQDLEQIIERPRALQIPIGPNE